MITDSDRRFYIGASDSAKVIAKNHNTKSWQEWWLMKLGAGDNVFCGNKFTDAGTIYEHPIIEAFDKEINKDRQVFLEDKMLRINYDGDKDGTIFEVKTHRIEKQFEVTPYIEAQVQTQMYVWKELAKRGELPEFKNLFILSYGLAEHEYYIERPEIDFSRIKVTKVKYQKSEVKNFLKCLEPLIEDLRQAKERILGE